MPRLKSQTGLLTSAGKRNLGTRIEAAGTISVGSPVVLNSNGTVSSVSGDGSTTNLTTTNFIGFSDSAVVAGQPAVITSEGSVTKKQSGLTPGSRYFVLQSGSLATSPDGVLVDKVPAGVAISATSLIVDPDVPNSANTSDATAVAVSMAIALG